MSKSTRSKKSKENCESTDDLVTNFINKPEGSEAAPRKRRKVEGDVLDDSLKFFKPLKPRAAKSSAAASSNAATNFINESSKKPVVVKPKPKAAPKTSKRKPKTQPDIRKVLSRQDQVYNQAVTENCWKEGLDPDEMQLAMAISESLKDQNKANENDDEPSTSSKFDNPFSSMGKVQPISAVLERFGFKSKTHYSEYELDLLTNRKITKRSKFTKFPTLLTRTSDSERTRMIQEKIDDVLDKENRQSSFKSQESFAFKVSSFYLQEMHENARTTFAISSEDRPVDEVLLSYYVHELFEPSFVQTGHLLKDWRKIPGRDPTPERQPEALSQNGGAAGDKVVSEWSEDQQGVSDFRIVEPQEELKKPLEVVPAKPEPIFSTSCEDIFADLDDCEIDENYFTYYQPADPPEESASDLNEQLDSLHVKISQSMVLENETNTETPAQEHSLVSREKDQETKELKNYSQGMLNVGVEDTPDVIDLTLRESIENDASIPYDDSYYSLQQHIMKFRKSRQLMSPPVSLSPEEEVAPVNPTVTDAEIVEICGSDSTIDMEVQDQEESQIEPPTTELRTDSPVASQNSFAKAETPEQIDLVSSEEETNYDNLFMNLRSFHTTAGEGEGDLALSQNSTQNSLSDDDEVIAISDEEINYSMRRFHNQSEDSNRDDGGSKEEDAIDLTQADDLQQCSQVEINNLVEQSLIDVMGPQEMIDINDTVTSLLETSVVTSSVNITRSNESVKFMQSEGLSDSLKEIMSRYGATMESRESPRSFRKMQSDSNLINESVKRRNTFQLELQDEDVVDLTQPLAEDEAKENSFNNMSIHQSLQNILSNTPIRSRTQVHRQRPQKKSLGVQIDDDYIVDTDTAVPEPEYSTMTPVELKQALFKYGIRPLPVKKAVTLLEFIFDQLHPKISVAADEEIDANDTRRAMNITDIVTDIGMKEDDEFVFQPGLVDDEEIVLPKSKKSKTSSCSIPLHISFYNMVRSNEKIQKFILEFRPIELDLVYKHFRKFGLSYELNDIISFLDRRCITFKTKEKSYSKTHERKKQKRAQKTQTQKKN